MNSFDFTDYFNLSVDRGDIDMLKVLWGKSIAMGTVGTEIRETITKRMPSIANLHGYDGKFDSFKELVVYHEDITSPLRTMPICNDYILFSISQSIPYTKEEFFRLLRKTSLKGVKGIFRVTQDANRVDYTTVPDEVFTFVSMCVDGEIETELRSNKVWYTVQSVEELGVLDCYFDPSAPPLMEVESNNFKIHTSSEDVIGKIIDMIENKREGFVTIDGLDNDGDLLPHMVYEDSGEEYRKISCCIHESNLFLSLNTEYRSTIYGISRDVHKIVMAVPSVCEQDYPNAMKRSVVGFELVMGVHEFGVRDSCFHEWAYGKNVAYYDSEDSNFCCFDEREKVLYLCIENPLLSAEVELTNDITYSVGRLVCEIPEYMYCYELRKV